MEKMREVKMSTLLIEFIDDKKKSFIRDLLAKYDFIKIIDSNESPTSKNSSSILLELSGLWDNYEIDIDILREKSWGRNNDID